MVTSQLLADVVVDDVVVECCNICRHAGEKNESLHLSGGGTELYKLSAIQIVLEILRFIRRSCELGGSVYELAPQKYGVGDIGRAA